MNISKVIKQVVFFLLSLIIGFVLHVCIFQNLVLGVVFPNVFLILTAALGFMYGSIYGMTFGFIAGLLLDSISYDYFGLNCLVLLTIGYLNGLLMKFFYGDDIRLPMLFIGASDVFHGIIIYIFTFLTRQRYDFVFYFLNIIMPEAVYSVLVFILLYAPLYKGLLWIKRDSTGRIIR